MGSDLNDLLRMDFEMFFPRRPSTWGGYVKVYGRKLRSPKTFCPPYQNTFKTIRYQRVQFKSKFIVTSFTARDHKEVTTGVIHFVYCRGKLTCGLYLIHLIKERALQYTKHVHFPLIFSVVRGYSFHIMNS